MARFNPEIYDSLILSETDRGSIGFFPEGKKLKSGRISGWYYNGRVFVRHVHLADPMANNILAYTDDAGLDPDYFVAVPEGTSPLVDILNYKRGLGKTPPNDRLVFSRKSPKLDHGDKADAHYIGDVRPGDRVIVIEDATTTGGSLLGQVDKCIALGQNVIATLCELNRLELTEDGKYSVAQAVKELYGIEHYSLSDAARILPKAAEKLKPERKTLDLIEEEYRDHGAVQIRF